jgi:tetratricopeptide (TPR) repeat protein
MNNLVLLSIASILAALPATAAGTRTSKGSSSVQSADARQSATLLEQGALALKSHQFSQAVTLFEQATRADSSSSEAFFRLGNSYYQRGFQRGTPEKADKNDAQNAVDALQSALTLDPKLRRVSDPYLLNLDMGLCLQALGRNEQALDSYKKASAAAQKNPMPELYTALLRAKMRDFERSSSSLESGVRRARRIDAYPALAKLVRRDGIFSSLLSVPQNKTVLDLYDAVQSGTLTEDEAHGRLIGTVEYRDSLRDIPSSEDRPSSLDSRRVNDRVQSAVDRGHGAYKAQRFREAIDAYTEALAKDERKGTLDAVQRSIVRERLGSSYRQLGMTAESAKTLENAVEEAPQASGAYYQLAMTYAVSGRLSLSLSALNKALENAATVPDLRQTLLLARADSELEPLRDLPRFRDILRDHSQKLTAKK